MPSFLLSHICKSPSYMASLLDATIMPFFRQNHSQWPKDDLSSSHKLWKGTGSSCTSFAISIIYRRIAYPFSIFPIHNMVSVRYVYAILLHNCFLIKNCLKICDGLFVVFLIYFYKIETTSIFSLKTTFFYIYFTSLFSYHIKSFIQSVTS